MKKRLLIICFFSASLLSNAQTDSQYLKNKYFISMYNLHEKNFDFTKALLEKYTEATSIDFNSVDSLFVISTYKSLDKKIVSGKMQKNLVPIKYIVLEGDVVEPFPSFVNTGNTDQDAIDYDTQKTNWIKKYPLEYKKMIANLKK